MAKLCRLFASPYQDDDFEWDDEKNRATFADRDLVLAAAKIAFRGRD